MLVLGIETSCDETSVAVIEDGRKLHSNVVLSQIDIHAKYGGVVPEVAARSHLEAMTAVVDESLVQAQTSWDNIDAIGVTYGAGLSGSLLIGVLTARTLAITKDKPLYACNHVEGHVYASYIQEAREGSLKEGSVLPSNQPQFPLLALIVSGGHSQLVLFKDHFDYQMLGVTVDDAIGEAFDKVAKILGLAYPGGPSIAKAATFGNPEAYELPKAQLSDPYNFSFSGLKTATLRLAQSLAGGDYQMPSIDVASKLSEDQINDISASFQKIAIETVVDKTTTAYVEFRPASVVIAGGVASSTELRRQLTQALTGAGFEAEIEYAPAELCTDNGAMIGCLACYHISEGKEPVDPYSLSIDPRLKM